jgi:DNA-binding MarR family transcriptional regulator
MGTSDLVALLELDSGERTSKELGAALRFTSASVTVLVDRLASAGFVLRKPHTTDRRRVLLMLTPRGRRVTKRLAELLAKDIEMAVADVSRSHWSALQLFMQAITARRIERSIEASMPGGSEPQGVDPLVRGPGTQ